MRRAWRVYVTFVKSSIQRELEFRANFIAKVFQSVGWMFFFLMMLLVIYRNTSSVAGWGRGGALVMAGTCFIIEYVQNTFFYSLLEIPEQVRKGTLDFVVTKPIDSQFWISCRKFNFANVGGALGGFVVVFIGQTTSHIHPNFASWSAYLFQLCSAIVIFYSFNMALMATGIWLVRVDNLFVLGESVLQVARYPMDIFSNGIKQFMTNVVPLAFLAYFPAKSLIVAITPSQLGLSLAWSTAAFLFGRYFWRFAVRSYTSASS
ncbi:MAG: ABC-2 family transporter protein [Armatimonadetes bacterium]|nr:ABC-2 family transporter protein [Armatimonadota bacterium]